MQIDPQGGGLDDQIRPATAPSDDGFPDDWFVPLSAQGDGFPDDWHVPPSAQGDGFPDDWFVPDSAALGTLQARPDPQPSADALGQFPPRPVRAPAFPPPPATSPLESLATAQPATSAPQFTVSSLFGGVTALKSASSDTSPYSKLFAGVAAPISETSDAPSPALMANFPVLDQPGSPPLGPERLLVSSEGGDREDEERRKFETPEIIGGLTEPGLGHPKQPPTLPSIPPLDVPPAGTEVWGLPSTVRGRILERVFGHNLHPNNPTVDIWDEESGSVTSLKSINLNSPTYKVDENNQNARYNKLRKYVNELAEFQGSRYADIYIRSEAIKSRTLTVIVPNVGAAAQQEVMRRIIELGRQHDVIVNFKIYP